MTNLDFLQVYLTSLFANSLYMQRFFNIFIHMQQKEIINWVIYFEHEMKSIKYRQLKIHVSKKYINLRSTRSYKIHKHKEYMYLTNT